MIPRAYLVEVNTREHESLLGVKTYPFELIMGAATGSVLLIVADLAAVLRGTGRELWAGGALALLYAALFGVLESEQNALLLGSLLLFALLAALMLGTRRVDWYTIGASERA